MAFRRNRRLAAELALHPATRQALRVRAEAAKARAEQLAPRGSGKYADSFVVTEAGVLRLGNTDMAAHLVEWGSANNPPYAPLRRGVRAAGLNFRETPK